MNYGQVDGSPFSRVSGDPFAGSPVSTREWRTSQPGSPSTPISLVDDSDSDSSVTLDNDSILRYDVEDVIDLEELNSRPERTIPRKRRASGETIDLTSDPQDSFNEGDFLTDEALERIVSTLGREERIEPREPDRPNNRRVVGEACVNGILYKAGQSVELRDKSYLRIFGVLEDTTGSLFFHGRRLFKLTSLAKRSEPKGYLPRWKNELVWIENDTSDIPLGDIRRFVSISFTNDIKSEESQRESDRGRRLFCRLKEVAVSNQVSVQYLSYHETDEMSVHRSPPWLLRQDWRGATRIFGETNKTAPSAYAVRVINLEDSSGPGIIDLTVPDTSESVISRLKDGRQYTFGDGFCGAGGVSAGARKAGLAIKWGFDKSRHAMDTYRLNFKEAICETSDIFHFLTNDPEEIKVDICHGSPPCQTFSAAHTVEAATDDANFACIFSCADLMKKVRPRILTMEETSGLYERHRDVFHRVIQSFLEIGYSVRWGLLKCVDYGVPQLRRRLIIIASGPGETLPAFPKPTHGLPGSGLLTQETINSILRKIEPGATDHDVEAALRRGLRGERKRPFDGDQQAKTVTTGGGEGNYHPSGERGFTNREFACLQTFDVSYQFGDKEVRKQIGNAVPPVMAKAIYREIVKSLKRTDLAEAREMVQMGTQVDQY